MYACAILALVKPPKSGRLFKKSWYLPMSTTSSWKFSKHLLEKSLKSIIFFCCWVLWFAAHAESNRFIGGHVQLATGYQLNTPVLDSYSNGQTNDSGNITGTPLVVGLGYTLSLSNQNMIGVTYEANLLNTRSATQTTVSGAGTSYSALGFASQQQYSLMLGHLISPYAMVYGKLGYATLTTTDADNNFTLPGFGVGLGYKLFFNDSQYFFTEYNQTRMARSGISSGSGNTFDAKSTGHEILFGVGLQF